MATLLDTPTITRVRQPRLRSRASTSVPAIGDRPCSRTETRSDGSVPISSAISTAGEPSSCFTGHRSAPRNTRALWLAPPPSPPPPPTPPRPPPPPPPPPPPHH